MRISRLLLPAALFALFVLAFNSFVCVYALTSKAKSATGSKSLNTFIAVTRRNKKNVVKKHSVLLYVNMLALLLLQLQAVGGLKLYKNIFAVFSSDIAEVAGYGLAD